MRSPIMVAAARACQLRGCAGRVDNPSRPPLVCGTHWPCRSTDASVSPSRFDKRRKEGSSMARATALGFAFVLTLGLLWPGELPAQTKDDTVVYAIQSDMQNWDPPNSVLRESIILGYHVFDHLAARDVKSGKVAPTLAVSWRNIDDATWEVKLRQNVKFHDGSRFTAGDVKATFDRVLDEKNKLPA